jgi:tetratricopeptide (TPR) repeat protein
MASPVYSPLAMPTDPVSESTRPPVAAPALPPMEVASPGQRVVAERYAIEREIGRGGTATVYLATDLRHRRPVAVKMLRPALAAGLGVERFRQEITVTANLQHPHILPIHESGEAEETLYFVMPYVEGESLRDRLARDRRLPLAEAVRIAREVAGALGYAHARGIIHRDIKPENILLTSGHAVVADFGLSLALGGFAAGRRRTDPGVVLGTLAYLSPEQASGVRSVDARSDQYSLAYLLYESLAGEPPALPHALVETAPAQSEDAPRPLHALRPELPGALDEVLRRALSQDPAARYETVAAFAEAFERAARPSASITRPSASVARTSTSIARRSRGRRWGALAVAGMLVVTSGWFALARARSPRMPARAWVVLAGVENRSGDTVLDRALESVIEAGLRQSAYVNILPRDRVSAALTRMRQDGGRAAPRFLDEGVAREVAQREAAQAVVVGAVERVDSTFVVSLRLVQASSGAVLASPTSVARTRAEVVDAVDDAVRQLRRSIGESADSLAKYDRPLPRATTRSLEALRYYGSALAAFDANDRATAVRLLERAVAVDSEFALAEAELGAAYHIDNDPRTGELHFQRALRFADRLTERERLHVLAAVQGWRGNRDAAIASRRTLLASYPDDRVVWGQLGYDQLRAGYYAEAVDAYRHALQYDSTDGGYHVNIATAYSGLKRHDDAIRHYRRAFALDSSLLYNNIINSEYAATLVRAGRAGEARAVYEKLLHADVFKQAQAARSLGLLAMSEGHYTEAIPWLRRAVMLSDRPGRELTRARNELFLASAFREKGASDSARAGVARTYALFRRTYLDPAFLVYLGSALAREGQRGAVREVLDTLRARIPPGRSPRLKAQSLVLEAELALADRRPDEALRRLAEADVEVDPSGRRSMTMEPRARALAALDRHGEAAQLWDRLAAERDEWFGSEGQELALVADVAAAREYEAAGDTAQARTRYERFLARWRTADPDLVSVREARARLVRLEPSGR